MLKDKAQAAPTARPKVLMRRRGADCLVVVSHRLCRPTANETLVSHCRLVGIELRRRVCFFVVLKRGNAPWSEGGGSSPLRSGQPATGGTRYSMEGRQPSCGGTVQDVVTDDRRLCGV